MTVGTVAIFCPLKLLNCNCFLLLYMLSFKQFKKKSFLPFYLPSITTNFRKTLIVTKIYDDKANTVTELNKEEGAHYEVS